MSKKYLGLIILVLVTLVVDILSLLSMFTISSPELWLILTPPERALENVRLTALVGFIAFQLILSAALLYSFFIQKPGE